MSPLPQSDGFEEVGVNEGDDILGEVGCLERDRREVPRLPKALHEPAPVGHPLDPRHRSSSVSHREMTSFRRSSTLATSLPYCISSTEIPAVRSWTPLQRAGEVP